MHLVTDRHAPTRDHNGKEIDPKFLVPVTLSLLENPCNQGCGCDMVMDWQPPEVAMEPAHKGDVNAGIGNEIWGERIRCLVMPSF